VKARLVAPAPGRESRAREEASNVEIAEKSRSEFGRKSQPQRARRSTEIGEIASKSTRHIW